MNAWEHVLIEPRASIREALIKIDEAGTQFALVADSCRRLLGTLSDGDIRRGLLKGLSLSDAVERCMCVTPTTVSHASTREEIHSLMRSAGLHQVPIVDSAGVVVGLEIVDDYLVHPDRQNWVVLMAGGLGSRLKELTRATPKPMLKVGVRPILETILKSFIDQGFRRFYLSLNYKAEVIEEYFGNGSRFGAEIRYLKETTRLGTAGSLSLIDEQPVEPLFVANGDLLAKVDYCEMLESHVESEAVATMGAREFEYQIPFGVVKQSDGIIRGIEEKPVQKVMVSAGIYVLSPEALNFVPKQSFFDMPNLFCELIARGRRTRCYFINGYWLDVGRMADFERANNEFSSIFEGP